MSAVFNLKLPSVNAVITDLVAGSEESNLLRYLCAVNHLAGGFHHYSPAAAGGLAKRLRNTCNTKVHSAPIFAFPYLFSTNT
ncbi:hypothetical protein KCP70_10220 [Salmonella enterica subsp. enterica]|nr:hypothetical protein KCP70_10220 [Salmonella enterica subsp. enterica]